MHTDMEIFKSLLSTISDLDKSYASLMFMVSERKMHLDHSDINWLPNWHKYILECSVVYFEQLCVHIAVLPWIKS